MKVVSHNSRTQDYLCFSHLTNVDLNNDRTDRWSFCMSLSVALSTAPTANAVVYEVWLVVQGWPSSLLKRRPLAHRDDITATQPALCHPGFSEVFPGTMTFRASGPVKVSHFFLCVTLQALSSPLGAHVLASHTLRSEQHSGNSSYAPSSALISPVLTLHLSTTRGKSHSGHHAASDALLTAHIRDTTLNHLSWYLRPCSKT